MSDSAVQNLPSNFSKKIDIMQNYTKDVTRINPGSHDDIKPNGDTTMIFPVKTMDLRTFALRFNAKTNGDATHMQGFPQYMACLIDTLTIYCNGTSVQHIPYYNYIYKLMKDYSIDFEEAVKRVGTNPDPSILTTRADDGTPEKYVRNKTTGVAGVNQFDDEYVIDDWIGFLGTCEPSIFNVNLVGTFEIHIKWADSRVLWYGNEGLDARDLSYTISKLFGYVDVLDFKDDGYYKGLEKKIASEGSIRIPFKNYRLQTGSETTDSKKSTTRFTESTQSLDKVMLTFFDSTKNTPDVLQLGIGNKTPLLPAEAIGDATVSAGDTALQVKVAADSAVALCNSLKTKYNDNVRGGYIAESDVNYPYLLSKNDPSLLNTSKYFKRSGLGMKNGTVQFEINSQLKPSFPLSLLAQYEETMKAFELNVDNKNKINPAIKDLQRFETDFYCCALSTSHINDNRDLTLISGLDTQSTSINVAVHVEQDSNTDPAQKATPIVITETTRILKIGAGRLVTVVH